MRAIAAVTTPGETAALCHSVGLARASFYRRRRPTPSLPPPPSRAPSPRALAADERQAMLATQGRSLLRPACTSAIRETSPGDAAADYIEGFYNP